MSDIVLNVTGMTCGHCVMSVTQALQQVPDVDKADVSLAQGKAAVHGTADIQAMIDAVQQAGYGATVNS
jgi:copper chaperone